MFLTARVSSQAPAILGRSATCGLAKGRCERAGCTKAEHQADFRHRVRRSRQQRLGMLDAAAAVIAVRWNAERLLESPTEIMRAQMNEPRQRRQRNLLGQVFLDILGGDPLL